MPGSKSSKEATDATTTTTQYNALHFPSLFVVETNVIKDEETRAFIRKSFIGIVSLTRLIYLLLIILSCIGSPVNGLPTISLLLATISVLPKLFIPFQCVYVLSISIMTALYTSSTHVTNNSKLLREWTEKDNGAATKQATIRTINIITIGLFVLLLPFLLLIHVCPVTEDENLHYAIAITGICLALFMHLGLFINRFIKLGLFKSFSSFINKHPTLSEKKKLRYKLVTKDILKNQTRLWINGISLFLGFLYAALFTIFINSSYESDAYTPVAISEYLLYDMVIVLDAFRIMDVYVIADI